MKFANGDIFHPCLARDGIYDIYDYLLHPESEALFLFLFLMYVSLFEFVI